jgi:hypothetical protein
VQRDTFYRPVKVWEDQAEPGPEKPGASNLVQDNLATV